MSSRTVAIAAVAAVALLTVAPAAPRAVKEGGTFRIGLDSDRPIDPALDYKILPGAPACGTLLTNPLRLRPDLAEALPVVSRDGKTYTFTIRKDARFSNGQKVTARAFSRALERMRDPALGLTDVYPNIRQVVPTGRTLTLRLAKRDPLTPALTTELCAVLPSLPVDPEGMKAPLPSAGPYYVADYVPGKRIRFERNRYYSGTRTRHVARFVVDLDADQGSLVDDIASGTYDWGGVNASSTAARAVELGRRYGINKRQYWVKGSIGLRLFVLNTSGDLFRNNPKLRQAVNFAIDRRELTSELGPYGAKTTDQFLLPVTPAFRDEHIYPWKPRNLTRAKALARGNLRSGKAVLYTPDLPVPLATAAIVRRNLEEIGLHVDITSFPASFFGRKLCTRGEPFDIGFAGWFDYQTWDPADFLSWMFDGRRTPPTCSEPGDFGDLSRFNSAKYNRLFDEASRLRGAARDRAYGDLDVQLSRDAAPAIPWAVINEIQFVSPRAGCVTFNPLFDLTAVCLK